MIVSTVPLKYPVSSEQIPQLVECLLSVTAMRGGSINSGAIKNGFPVFSENAHSFQTPSIFTECLH